MRTGPHRKLQLLGGPTVLISNTLNNATSDTSAGVTPKTNKDQPQVPQLTLGHQSSAQTTPIASGRSQQFGVGQRTPTRKQVKKPSLGAASSSEPISCTSPRVPDNKSKIFTQHIQRSSLSQSQLNTVLTSSKSFHPVLKKGDSKQSQHIRRQTQTSASVSSFERGGKQSSGKKKRKTKEQQPFNYEEKKAINAFIEGNHFHEEEITRFTHSRIGSRQYYKEMEEQEEEEKTASKSDQKTPEYIPSVVEKFEVIREDEMNQGYFQSPNLIGQRQNSDFKKFNAEEEFQNQVNEQKRLQQTITIQFSDPFKHERDDNLSPNNELDNDQHSFDRALSQNDFEDSPKNQKNHVEPSLTKFTASISSQKQFAALQKEVQSPKLFSLNEGHVLSFSDENQPIFSPEQNLQAPNFSSEDPQAEANKIIEMQKNYVIQQYEQLLQQLSQEFQKVLQKTKETDEHLAKQELIIQAQQKVIQEKEATQFTLEQVNQQLSSQVQELLGELETNIIEKERLMQTNHQEDLQAALSNQSKLFDSMESSLKHQLDQYQQKLQKAESKMRQKDEEIFSLHRQNQGLHRDLDNLREIESNLKSELQRVTQAQLSAEQSMQDLRGKQNMDMIAIRARESEVESMTMQGKAMQTAMEVMQQSYAQVMAENEQLREALDEIERAQVQMRAGMAERERELEEERRRVEAARENERKRTEAVEEDLRKRIEQLQRREIERNQEINRMGNTSFSEQNRYINETQQIVSPRRTFEQGETIKTQWISNKPESSVVPQAFQTKSMMFPMREDEMRTSAINQRKKSIMNQNTSQLHDLLSWEQGNNINSSISNFQAYKSLERTSIQNIFGGLNRVQAQTYFAGAPASHNSPRSTGQSRTSVMPRASSYSDNEYMMPAAGKKTIVDSSNPFGAASHEGHQKQITTLQNTLSAMQMEKERYENEYRKMGTSKNKQQIQKKQELEFEIEVINKNIHQIKQRLRDQHHAF